MGNTRVGEKYVSNEGYELEIVEYTNTVNCTVLINNTTIVKNITYDSIKRGKVRNPYHKMLYSVGYFGEGIYNLKNKYYIRIYSIWAGILRRCYDEKFQEEHPTYKGVVIYEEWYNFQVFAKWFEDNWKSHMIRWHLDKDILVKGNKIYSPETCCFVPYQINNIFTTSNTKNLSGVVKKKNSFRADYRGNYLGSFNTSEEAFQTYKVAKELWIKKVADEWGDRIEPEVYQAMYNWSVEITD